MMMGFGMFGGLFALLFFGVVVVGMLFTGRGMMSHRHRYTRMNIIDTLRANREESLSPLDELNKRYANGELDREVYLQIKRDLEV